MSRYGPIWADMDRYGPIWVDMGRYGAIWADIGRYGPIWGDMGRYGPIWPFDAIRSQLVSFRPMRTYWDPIKMISNSITFSEMLFQGFETPTKKTKMTQIYKSRFDAASMSSSSSSSSSSPLSSSSTSSLWWILYILL